MIGNSLWSKGLKKFASKKKLAKPIRAFATKKKFANSVAGKCFLNCHPLFCNHVDKKPIRFNQHPATISYFHGQMGKLFSIPDYPLFLHGQYG